MGSAAAGAATSVGAPQLAPVAGAIGYNVGKKLGSKIADKTEDKLREQTRRMRQPKNRSAAKVKPRPIEIGILPLLRFSLCDSIIEFRSKSEIEIQILVTMNIFAEAVIPISF